MIKAGSNSGLFLLLADGPCPAAPSPLPHTTLTVFTLRPGHRHWGLAQMGTSPPHLRRVPGLRFFKLLGSGATRGFGLMPNWDRYALLAVWEAPAAAAAFEAEALWAGYERRTQELWQLDLQPIKAHGRWDGLTPFSVLDPTSELLPDGDAAGPVAVLTRASIRWQQAARFWRDAGPGGAPLRALAEAPGVRMAIGLGELPVVRQATFSVWDSEQAVQDYAYRDARHRDVIQRTRRENWYSEELFARFRVLGSRGTLDGYDPAARLHGQCQSINRPGGSA